MIRFATAALLTAMLASSARACSCSNGGPRTAARSSSAVYLARVVGLGPQHEARRRTVRTARLVVTLTVKGAQKGDTVEVDTDVESSCSVVMQVGHEYLVYGVTSPIDTTRLFTDYCAGTKSVDCAANDLKELGIAIPRRARSCRPPAPRDRHAPANVALPKDFLRERRELTRRPSRLLVRNVAILDATAAKEESGKHNY